MDAEQWGLALAFDLDDDQGLLFDIEAWCRRQRVRLTVVVTCTGGPDGVHRAAVFLERGSEVEAALRQFQARFGSLRRIG